MLNKTFILISLLILTHLHSVLNADENEAKQSLLYYCKMGAVLVPEDAKILLLSLSLGTRFQKTSVDLIFQQM
jgi:hypothetical protein